MSGMALGPISVHTGPHPRVGGVTVYGVGIPVPRGWGDARSRPVIREVGRNQD